MHSLRAQKILLLCLYLEADIQIVFNPQKTAPKRVHRDDEVFLTAHLVRAPPPLLPGVSELSDVCL